MALHPNFPESPYAILEPGVRWFPADETLRDTGMEKLMPPLVAQLKPGGRMVIPVGAPFHTQELVLLTKDADGRVAMREILPVAFVALTGGPGR